MLTKKQKKILNGAAALVSAGWVSNVHSVLETEIESGQKGQNASLALSKPGHSQKTCVTSSLFMQTERAADELSLRRRIRNPVYGLSV